MSTNSTVQPDISVLIATYNRAESLRRTLQSLQHADGADSLSYEILVIDNNSSDGTKDVVEEAKGIFQDRLVYRFVKPQGKSYAMNEGIRTARGRVIAFTDDDCRVSANYLTQLRTIFERDDIDFAGGRIKPDWEDEKQKPDWIRGPLFLGPLAILDYGPEPIIINKGMMKYRNYLFYGANIAFRRDVFEKFGMFREDKILAEDTEMCIRLIEAGCRAYYDPSLVVTHKVPVSRTTKQYFTRWYYLRGIYRDHFDMEYKPYHIFGIPFWMMMNAMKELFWSYIKKEEYDRLLHRCYFYSYLGGMSKRIKGCFST